ncbi:MAG TPA: hypothetical protein VGQ93_04080, partial [Lysobacter sp.]|nr:hypothetical protein [Lysobacter sp.]
MRGAANIVATTAARVAWAGLMLLMLTAAAQDARDAYVGERHQLIAELRADDDPRLASDVLAVMGRVPRHQFVPATQRRDAYDNRPLSIGYGQTISQPYIVALMTSLARPKHGQTILEIGT